MKEYRVHFINDRTGRRNRRNFATLKGAMKFMEKCGGPDNCALYKLVGSYFEHVQVEEGR